MRIVCKVVFCFIKIFLNDHPESKEDVLRAFDNIPYNGEGERTVQQVT